MLHPNTNHFCAKRTILSKAEKETVLSTGFERTVSERTVSGASEDEAKFTDELFGEYHQA